MEKILIYGINQQAQVLSKLIQKEKKAEVTAFVADAAYRKETSLLGLPVEEAEQMKKLFSPDEYKICLSFGYKNMVYNRREKFNFCKENGYRLFTYISEDAHVYTEKIGESCIIYPGSTIMPFVEIGDGCFIEAGCVIAHHCKIGKFNFIAPGVHFCGGITTGENCFFGSAAEIVNNSTIEDRVFVAAGAKVNGRIAANSTIMPAKSAILEKDSFSAMEQMFSGEKK